MPHNLRSLLQYTFPLLISICKNCKKTLCWFCERVLFIYSLFLLLLFCLCVNWNIRRAIDSKRTKHTHARTREPVIGRPKFINYIAFWLVASLCYLLVYTTWFSLSSVCQQFFCCCVLSLSPSILQTNGQKTTARYTFLSFCIYERSAMCIKFYCISYSRRWPFVHLENVIKWFTQIVCSWYAL